MVIRPLQLGLFLLAACIAMPVTAAVSERSA
jgi:hypothetical protein